MSNNEQITYQDKSTISGGTLAEIQPAQQAGALKGAQILATCLRAEGVDVLFGYPGGANLEIFDVLEPFGIHCIRVEHEQGAAHAAQGYARATGKVGVCLATSGPGATNLVTGIADANSDSTPIVAITGNVPTPLLGKNAFQEVDIVSITKPITKRSYLVNRVSQIPEVVRGAFALAKGKRPGPVLIDIPKDIQQHYPRDMAGNYIAPTIPAQIEPPESTPEGLTDNQLEQCERMIAESSRTVIYAGGGIVSAQAEDLLLQLAETLNCPVTTTLMGKGSFPPDHPLWLNILGMHGSRAANTAVNEADLVLALGVRFDDRVTGKVSTFIEHGKVIHIDIDRDELNKNKTVVMPICSDIGVALTQLLERIRPNAGQDSQAEWRQQCAQLCASYPFDIPPSEHLKPQYVIAELSKATDGEAIVSVGVGQHQMWAMQHYESRQTRSFLSSSGFGTMGYGLPAAMGAKVGAPGRIVIDIDGDGSFNMSIHELGTCRRHQIGVKIVIINNQWLGMVRQWQDMIYQGHRAGTNLSDPVTDVKPDGIADIYPDFVTIARGYRVRSERVSKKSELPAAFERLLADPAEPYVLDVIVDAEENVYPMIPAGATYRDIIMSQDDLSDTTSDNQGSNI